MNLIGIIFFTHVLFLLVYLFNLWTRFDTVV